MPNCTHSHAITCIYTYGMSNGYTYGILYSGKIWFGDFGGLAKNHQMKFRQYIKPHDSVRLASHSSAYDYALYQYFKIAVHQPVQPLLPCSTTTTTSTTTATTTTNTTTAAIYVTAWLLIAKKVVHCLQPPPYSPAEYL